MQKKLLLARFVFGEENEDPYKKGPQEMMQKNLRDRTLLKAFKL